MYIQQLMWYYPIGSWHWLMVRITCAAHYCRRYARGESMPVVVHERASCVAVQRWPGLQQIAVGCGRRWPHRDSVSTVPMPACTLFTDMMPSAISFASRNSRGIDRILSSCTTYAQLRTSSRVAFFITLLWQIKNADLWCFKRPDSSAQECNRASAKTPEMLSDLTRKWLAD